MTKTALLATAATVLLAAARQGERAPGDTHDLPDREIGWQSEPGGEIDNAGKVEFLPAGARGTIVRVTTAYDPPGGVIGRTIAKLLQRELGADPL